ncbi:MAG: gluconolactonase, partial [Acidobacteria bacterium]
MKHYSIIAILSMAIAMAGAQLQTGNVGTVVHVDPALDGIIPANPEIQKVAGGFKFVEGPIWTHEGFLLFS